MKPIKFSHSNVIYAENQPEYLPLPSHKSADGVSTACWAMNWRERLRVLITGKIYAQTMTFNKPLQPQSVWAKNPLENN